MNRGWNTDTRAGGYTVVETLIFLSVSAAMFVSAAVLIGGRQGRMQFTNAVREFEAQIIDVANDVGTGYYEGDTGLTCSIDGTGNPFVGGLPSKDCIFVGRTVALGPTFEQYDTYTMVGLRLVAGKPVSQLSHTRPRVFDSALKKTTFLEGGATIACVKIGLAAGCSNTAVSFVSRLNGNLLESSSVGGSGIVADLYTSSFSSPGAANINASLPPIKLPSNQALTICLRSGSSNQHAIITLAGASSVSIRSEIGQGAPPATSCA